MKTTFTLSLIFASLVIARADLVMQQKTTGLTTNDAGIITIIKIKGDKILVQTAGPDINTSVITDAKTGERITLIHSQKMAIKMSGAQTKILMEKLAAVWPKDKPQDTGKSEKIGNNTAEIFTFTGAHGTGTIWVAKDFPNYAKIRQQMDTLGGDSPFAANARRQLFGFTDLPGLVIKSKWKLDEMTGKTVTSELVSLTDDTVDAADFDLPKDYKVVSQTAPALEYQQK